MLKIVDYYPNTKIPFPLKELEKFGIKQYGQHYNAITKFSIPYLSILNECGRKIVCYTNEDLDVLFDLIQAGLVEKVEEKNGNQ